MQNIKIQYLNDDIKRLEYIDGKSLNNLIAKEKLSRRLWYSTSILLIKIFL